MRSRHIAFGVAAGPLPRTGAEELAAGSGPSAGYVGEAGVDFGRSAEAEAEPGAVVEFGSEGGALALSERGEVSAFGQVLSKEPIGILIGAAFPSVMGKGEVDFGVEALLESFVHMELSTVVRSDGVDGMRFVAQDVGGALEGLLRADAGEFADAYESTLAFDHCDCGRLAAAVDGVDLPVAEPGARGDDLGSVGNHAFAGEASAAVLAGIALPASLVGAAEMAPEGAAVGSVVPDVEVDRFDAHHAGAFGPQATNDLLGTDVVPQHAFDGHEVLGDITLIPPRSAAAAVRLLHGELSAVEAIVRTAVALDLAIDGRAMPAKSGRDLLNRVPLAAHRGDGVSFFGT